MLQFQVQVCSSFSLSCGGPGSYLFFPLLVLHISVGIPVPALLRFLSGEVLPSAIAARRRKLHLVPQPVRVLYHRFTSLTQAGLSAFDAVASIKNGACAGAPLASPCSVDCPAGKLDGPACTLDRPAYTLR